jgi:hypothetical protein
MILTKIGGGNMRKIAGEKEKTMTAHYERIIHTVLFDDEVVDIVMTKHGHYRILENKNISLSEFGKTIASIGRKEIEMHFKKALVLFPVNKRKKNTSRHKIDYTIALYDMVNEMVVILGLHPHFKRLTVVTIIPRIKDVYTDVFGAYRFDSKETFHKTLTYTFSRDIKMNSIHVF